MMDAVEINWDGSFSGLPPPVKGSRISNRAKQKGQCLKVHKPAPKPEVHSVPAVSDPFDVVCVVMVR